VSGGDHTPMPGAGQIKPAVMPRLPDRDRGADPDLPARAGGSGASHDRADRAASAAAARPRGRLLHPGQCLFAQVGYEEVMRLLVEGLAWARARLGPAPLRALFAEVARPLATPATKGAWYRGWRLVALDGTTLDVADTPATWRRSAGPLGAAARGVPAGAPGGAGGVRHPCGPGRGPGRAATGGALAGTVPSLARSLHPGMLLVDQGMCSLELWRTLQATGRSCCALPPG
jgi:hypothetical protein